MMPNRSLEILLESLGREGVSALGKASFAASKIDRFGKLRCDSRVRISHAKCSKEVMRSLSQGKT